MDSFLLAYINQRMCELGYLSYRYEPVRVSDPGTEIVIPAYNEYYYMTSKFADPFLLIISDTNIFNEASAFPTYNLYSIQEFTGLIEIFQEFAPVNVEFVKVVPSCNCTN